MTEKQYRKYIVDVTFPVIKIVWCVVCKNKNKCDAELKEKCCIRYETKHHTDYWDLDVGLKKANERQARIKELIKEAKRELKNEM